ncbi:MAG: DUF3866 family protein [Actinobacteria bacterium]|nr:DUF3866 family protein [Actinomycetota bacterium]
MSLKRAKVLKKLRSAHGRTDLTVEVAGDEVPAVAYEAIVGEVDAGDEVVVNTVAVDLGLGSGGNHFVLWNLKKEQVTVDGPGHIMKLRYTPLQFACLAVEEEESPYHEGMMSEIRLDGMPVVVGTLHSQLAPAAATLKFVEPGLNVAYIMTDGAALPLALSDTVAQLKEKKLINTTITCGNAYGGDLEAINIFSALVAARVAAKADVTIVTMGPGIVGTDTPLGFTAMEQGQVVNAVFSLQGRPVAVPRISFKDKRLRHYGLSHHTLMALAIAAQAPCAITLPEMSPEKFDEVMTRVDRTNLRTRHKILSIKNDITKKALTKFGLKVSTMGRGFDEDPEFFLAAGAAAVYALELVKGVADER